MEAAVVRLVRFALVAILCAAGVALANTTVTSPITFGSGLSVAPDGTVSATATSGALTLISTQTASGSASLAFTGLSGTYKSYQLRCYGIQPANDGVEFSLQIGTGATPTYQTTLYTYVNVIWDGTAAGAVNTGSSQSKINLTNTNGHVNNTSSGSLQATVNFANVDATTFQKPFDFITGYYDDLPAQAVVHGSGVWVSNTAITAVKVFFSAGNIAAGSCSLYGYAT